MYASSLGSLNGALFFSLSVFVSVYWSMALAPYEIFCITALRMTALGGTMITLTEIDDAEKLEHAIETGAVHPLVIGCDLCMTASDDVIHLPLYVIGSEGIRACLACRIVLSNVAKGLRSAAGKARKDGFLAGKTVCTASR
jgi:hypothetical protein